MSIIQIIDLLQPESALEQQLIETPELQEGLIWGSPRPGHPEGQVYKHILEVFDNIDQLPIDADERQKLRIIAIVHDSFKFKEVLQKPRSWPLHHAVLAKRFLQDFLDDSLVLKTIQYHDEAYYIWRHIHVFNNDKQAQIRMHKFNTLFNGNELQFYYHFFKSDTYTGNKLHTPVEWFESYFEIKKVSFANH